MKLKDGESLESWADRVQQYEYGRALMRIAEGESVDVVIEEMSVRIVEKIKHSILKQLHQDPVDIKERVAKSKEDYNRYMSKIGPHADHIEEE